MSSRDLDHDLPELEVAAARSDWGPLLDLLSDTNLTMLRSCRDLVSSMVLARLGERCRSSMERARVRSLGSASLSPEVLRCGTDCTEAASSSARLVRELARWERAMVTWCCCCWRYACFCSSTCACLCSFCCCCCCCCCCCANCIFLCCCCICSCCAFC